MSLIREIEKEFGPICFDLAAEPHNKKHERYFGPERIVVGIEKDSEGKDRPVYEKNPDTDMVAIDALSQDWHSVWVKGKNLWLNPEFADIAPWASKYRETSEQGASGLLLVPAAVGSNWFRDHVFGACADVYLLNGRVPFKGENSPGYNKDCMIVHYHERFHGWERKFVIWNWKKGTMFK